MKLLILITISMVSLNVFSADQLGEGSTECPQVGQLSGPKEKAVVTTIEAPKEGAESASK